MHFSSLCELLFWIDITTQLSLISVFCSLQEDDIPLAIYEENTKDSCGIEVSLPASRSHDNAKPVTQPFLCRSKKRYK